MKLTRYIAVPGLLLSCCFGVRHQNVPDPDYPKRPLGPRSKHCSCLISFVTDLYIRQQSGIDYQSHTDMRMLFLLSVLGVVLNRVETHAFELPKPTRPLEWKDINVISISDSHGKRQSRFSSALLILLGWLLGHQHVRVILAFLSDIH